ncbi:MAG TPA: 1-acyl-sn-glycerol-3-phosphate acyltransferase [Spirochaetia bacterium]|nr:1-acyl-sn-glycerol-3-phosphate acyltransferase [Spirochaetia bacterium]
MSYTDISAYPESRLRTTIKRLFSDPQFRAILKKAWGLPRVFNKKNLASVFHWVKTFSSIDEFQSMMFHLVSFNLRTTSDGLTATGLSELSQGNGPKLFLSNHRSTVLDTSYLNFVLAGSGLPTVYSAAGDNLMKTAWIQHLIRLNKGFVVKRNVEGVQEKLDEARRLSSYISDLLDEGNSVWIAHRGGRAKNGDDKTDSAVLKMLSMNGSFSGFGEWSARTRIVPMTISWEQLPQDEILAREVAGELEPSVGHRDLLNIVGEINGWKGRVHIAFGERIKGATRGEIVSSLDREIQTNFRLWDANWLAYARTSRLAQAARANILAHIDLARGERVLSRAAKLTRGTAEAFLSMYARPVVNALKHVGTIDDLLNDQKRRFAGPALVAASAT